MAGFSIRKSKVVDNRYSPNVKNEVLDKELQELHELKEAPRDWTMPKTNDWSRLGDCVRAERREQQKRRNVRREEVG